MRKDYRLKNPYDLRYAIGKYHQIKNLKHYFKLYSADDNSIDSSLSNLANEGGKPATGFKIDTVNDSPYTKLVRYTSHCLAWPDGTGWKSYYRIPFGGDAFDSFKNDGEKATIAFWVSLDDLKGPNQGGSNIVLNKIQPGNAPGLWATKGEFRIQYTNDPVNDGSKKNRIEFIWAGRNSIIGANYQLTIPTRNLDTLNHAPATSASWIHVAVVIKTAINSLNEPTLISDVVNLYVNGQQAIDTTDISGGDGGSYASTDKSISQHWSPNQVQGDILLGRGKGDQAGAGNPVYKGFHIYDLAIWNTNLDVYAINSIYNTSQYFQGTGFLSLGPRVQIRQRPNLSQLYFDSIHTPTLNKPASSPFRDDRVINYHDNVMQTLQYPFGLPSPGIDLDQRVSSSLASPNLMPDIAASGFTNFNILNSYYTPDQIDEGGVVYLPYNDTKALPNTTGSFYGPTTSIYGFSSRLQDKIQITLELPLNETLQATRHSAKWDKAQAFGGHTNPHFGGSNTGLGENGAEFYDKDVTGFFYYNKSEGKWEQKGANDVVYGTPITSSEIAQETKPQSLEHSTLNTREYKGYQHLTSGSSNSMRLFYPGGSTAAHGQYYGGGTNGSLSGLFFSGSGWKDVSVGVKDKQLAANIGSPMVANYGPNAIQYFATSSQVLKMSNYISEPFLLEKVILEIPSTIARKVFDYSRNVNSPTAARPQDDYVFFLMRQERNYPGINPQITPTVKDLHIEASSSMRYLICSGNACFYNSRRRVPGITGTAEQILSGGLSASGSAWAPYNSPTVSYDFAQPITSLTNNRIIMSRTGSLNLQMEPAVASQKILGNYFLPSWDGTQGFYLTQSISSTSTISLNNGLAPVVIDSFWPGGTSTLPLSGAISGSREDLESTGLDLARLPSATKYSFLGETRDSSIYNARTFFQVNPHQYDMPTKFPARVFDTRSYKYFGAGATSDPLPALTTSGSWQTSFADSLAEINAPSPYLLFPEDELILGLDAALGWTATMAAGITAEAVDSEGDPVDGTLICGAHNLTGSILTLLQGAPMTLRLFGSLVKDQIQAPHYPEPIAQPDINVPIIGKHVLDQYDISPLMANSGSYRTRLYTGSLTMGEGAGRTENPGIPITTNASSPSPFFWNPYPSHPAPYDNITQGPAPNSVITCSIPHSVTGLFKDYPTNSAPLNHVYLRFVGGTKPEKGNHEGGASIQHVSASLQSGAYGSFISGSHPGPAADEIYISNSPYIKSSSYTGINSYQLTLSALMLVFNGTYSNINTRNYFICTGSAFRGDAAGARGEFLPPVPGFEQSQWSSDLLSFSMTTEDPGVAGNQIFFTAGSGSSNTHYETWAGTDTVNPVAGYRNLSGSAKGIIANFTASFGGGLVNSNPLRAMAATATRGDLGEFGSFNRFVTLIDNSEIYYDSMVPSVLNIWSCLGKTPEVVNVTDLAAAESGAASPGELEILLFGISVGNKAFGGSSGSGVLENPFSANWWGAYPFEPKFRHLRRTLPTGEVVKDAINRVKGTAAVKDPENRVAATLFWMTDDVYQGVGQGFTMSGSFGFSWWDLLGGQPASGSNEMNAQIGFGLTMDSQTFGQAPSWGELAQVSLKSFYGIGDGFGNLITNTPENDIYPTGESYSGTSNEVDAAGLYPPFYKIIRRSRKPRGWKYGLLNAVPQKTQAVYRSDTFGQFRDMLEGRKYAVFSENIYDEAPINVAFVTPPWQEEDPTTLKYVTDPADTRSSNLSMHATSSLPFFDTLTVYPFGRNRPFEIETEEITIEFPTE